MYSFIYKREYIIKGETKMNEMNIFLLSLRVFLNNGIYTTIGYIFNTDANPTKKLCTYKEEFSIKGIKRTANTMASILPRSIDRSVIGEKINRGKSL